MDAQFQNSDCEVYQAFATGICKIQSLRKRVNALQLVFHHINTSLKTKYPEQNPTETCEDFIATYHLDISEGTVHCRVTAPSILVPNEGRLKTSRSRLRSMTQHESFPSTNIDNTNIDFSWWGWNLAIRPRANVGNDRQRTPILAAEVPPIVVLLPQENMLWRLPSPCMVPQPKKVCAGAPLGFT